MPPMVAPADPTSLQLLRHRFLMEDPDLVTQWLWEEHPQTAAFLLNWLGAPPVLTAYMTPLPLLQQADVLHRIASLGVDHQPTAYHEEILIDALRRISPYLREAGSDLTAEDPVPKRGVRLIRPYLGVLNTEELQQLLEQMAEVDPAFARVGALLGAQASTGNETSDTVHGILNGYCDLLGFAFSRCFSAQTVVYPERVDMVAASGFADEDLGRRIPFRLALAGCDSHAILLISTPLFIRYLEYAFGSGTPYQFQDVAKPELSGIEIEVAVSLGQILAGYLDVALGLDEEGDGYQVEPFPADDLAAELKEFGKTPILDAQLTFKVGQALSGGITLLMPPSHLVDLQSKVGKALFDTLLGGALPGPPAPTDSHGAATGAGASSERPLADFEAKLDAGAGDGDSPDRDDAHSPADDDDPSGTLEEFLWKIELEEAEKAIEEIEPRPAQPLDLFLRGYAPEKIAEWQTVSGEEKERLAELHYFYGTQLFQKGLFADAAEALEKTVTEHSGHEGGRLLLAAAWGELGLYFKEIVAYKKLIAEGLALPESQVLLARRLSFLGRTDDAFTALKAANDLGYQPEDIVEADPCFRALQKSVKWRQYLIDRS